MRIVEISKKLYRVYNAGKVKDVWIDNGKIKPPENPYNILTPTEEQAVEMEIF